MSLIHVNYRWLMVLFALAYGMFILSLDVGNGFSSLTPYHRYQAMALLQRHFYLASSIDAVRPGLAWYNGHVQQVWGLGVAFWLLPFQVVWQLLGGHIFPDRLALGAAFALLAFYTGDTGLKIGSQGHRAMALGLIWLILLCPPLWTLARVSQSVFEQTVLYAILVSLGILVSLVRVAWIGSTLDYLLCCTLSTLAIWVRPTHGIYGLSAILIGSLILLLRQHAVKKVILGCIIFFVGLALLGLTNEVRFGSPQEFGHRLTVSSNSMVYLTRFENPFLASGPSAAEELIGMLFFDSNVRGANAYAEDLFPGQTQITRWRRLDLTTFDPIYGILCLAAAGGGSYWLIWRQKGKIIIISKQPVEILIGALFLWSSLSGIILGVFYLYFPIMASRYLMDFAPAIIGLIAAGWVMIPSRFGKFLWPLLGIWLLYEIVAAQVPAPTLPGYARQETDLPPPKSPLKIFGGIYTLDHHPADTGIDWNGHGWEPQNGFADDLVTLVVDKPEYIELLVDNRRGSNGEKARKDVYQAMIDGVLLPLRKVAPADNGWTVVFEIPPDLRKKLNDEVLFLCFSRGYDKGDRDSERILYSVRWR